METSNDRNNAGRASSDGSPSGDHYALSHQEPGKGPPRFGSPPIFFKALIAEGKMWAAGYELAGHTDGLFVNANYGDEALISDCLEGLHEFAFENDGDSVLEWYETHFPQAMVLVPKGSQRAEFIAGILEASDDGTAFETPRSHFAKVKGASEQP